MAESAEGLRRLQDCKPVKGTLILDRADARIIESQGSIFEGDQGKKYARACRNIITAITDNLNDVDQSESVGVYSSNFTV